MDYTHYNPNPINRALKLPLRIRPTTTKKKKNSTAERTKGYKDTSNNIIQDSLRLDDESRNVEAVRLGCTRWIVLVDLHP